MLAYYQQICPKFDFVGAHNSRPSPFPNCSKTNQNKPKQTKITKTNQQFKGHHDVLPWRGTSNGSK
jgi:hypothetical protein